MKRKYIIILVVALIALLSYTKTFGLPVKLIGKEEQKQLSSYQQQLNRQQELQTLQYNSRIIEQQLKNVGKLITLEGTMNYQKSISESGMFGYITLREITLDIWYQFGLGIDLQYIKIKTNTEGEIVLLIPKSRIQLCYLQFDQNKSKVINGKKFIFANQFRPSDVETVIAQSQGEVSNKIGNDKRYYDMAMQNLKAELQSMVYKMNIENVKFEEI